MLITRRKQGESLLIGDQIEVIVLEINAGRVKLGVTAPGDVVVERKEIRAIAEQNQAALRSGTSPFVRTLLQSRAALPEAGGTGTERG